MNRHAEDGGHGLSLVLSLSKDESRPISWFDELTTSVFNQNDKEH